MFFACVFWQEQLAKARVSCRQAIVTDAVLLHCQAEVLPTPQRYTVACRDKQDELHLFRICESRQDLPEDWQVLKFFLRGPTFVGGTSLDRGHINRDSTATHDLFELHCIHHATEQRRIAENCPETCTERFELLTDALAEKPIDVGLHKLSFVRLSQLAICCDGIRALPSEIAKDLSNVVFGIIQNTLQTLRNLITHRC